MSGQWAGSTRRSRLPKDWAKTRARILKRDGHRCWVCGQPGATEVDHVQPGDNHAESNLAAIHTDCHKAKTAAEGVQARAARPQRQRPTEAHPGLRSS